MSLNTAIVAVGPHIMPLFTDAPLGFILSKNAPQVSLHAVTHQSGKNELEAPSVQEYLDHFGATEAGSSDAPIVRDWHEELSVHQTRDPCDAKLSCYRIWMYNRSSFDTVEAYPEIRDREGNILFPKHEMEKEDTCQLGRSRHQYGERLLVTNLRDPKVLLNVKVDPDQRGTITVSSHKIKPTQADGSSKPSFFVSEVPPECSEPRLSLMGNIGGILTRTRSVWDLFSVGPQHYESSLDPCWESLRERR